MLLSDVPPVTNLHLNVEGDESKNMVVKAFHCARHHWERHGGDIAHSGDMRLSIFKSPKQPQTQTNEQN